MKTIKKQIIILSIFTIFTLALCGAASAENGAWHNETIENGEISYTSIAIDSLNNTHISYFDANNGDLKYACDSSGSWVIETVDSIGNIGGFNSIAIDSSNNPHISYFDGNNYDLKYAFKSGGVWTIETVDSTGDVGMYNSLALDSSGNPHISYFDAANGSGDLTWDLKYAVKSSGVWTIQTVEGDSDGGYDTSLALDSSNNPHISYTDYNYGHPNIKYAYYDGSAWQIETAITGGGGGCGESSIALDSAGNPNISFRYIWGNETNAILALKYAYKDGSGWHQENADTLYSGPSGTVGNFQIYDSLTLDNSGNPHISYYDPVTKSLKYTYKDNTGWHNQIIDSDSESEVGKYTSLALDASGNPHISYQGSLKHAYFVSSQGNTDNSNNQSNPSENSSSVHVNAASTTRTIGMQETGIPINYLILAILAVISGLVLPKRK